MLGVPKGEQNLWAPLSSPQGPPRDTGLQKLQLLHWPGIEPGPPAWQARILPLNHQCQMWGTPRHCHTAPNPGDCQQQGRALMAGKHHPPQRGNPNRQL